MKSWIITGGAGCGKSTVLTLLTGLFHGRTGHFSADDGVRTVFEKPEVCARLLAEFGPLGLVAGDAPGIRDWLRVNVLPVTALRTRLEGILHPPALELLEKARNDAESSGMNLFLAEVPLHYEIGSTVSADFVIVVASSRSMQVRRMMETRGLDEQTVHKFLDAQWPIEAKVERADAVIWNDGSPASLEAQVLTLASPLLQA